MTHSTPAQPRLVLYGIGQYGSHVARMTVAKGWPIMAAFNRAGSKVGQDLGRVIGLGRDLGVVIQDCDTADYSRLSADIGVVATTNLLRQNMAAYKRLVSAGLNVLCHGAQSYYPYASDPEAAAEIEAMARSHGVSFTGGGIWDMSRIWSGLLVAGPCTHIRSLFHSSITDAQVQAATPQQAMQVGCGMTVQEFFDKGLDKSPLPGSYKTIPQHVLAALGLRLKETRVRIEPVSFEVPIETKLMGVLPAGRCLGSRIIVDVDTEEGVTAHAEIDVRFFRPGEIEHMFWSVDGMPRTSIRTERLDSDYATAACLFNRIPDVIGAAPGIVPVSQLGPLKPSAFSSQQILRT